MEDSINLRDQCFRIQAILRIQLKKFYELCPRYFSTSMYVLPVIDESVEDQLKQFLERENIDHQGERIVLVAYHLENTHWIGILLKFQAQGQLTSVEYIDPLNRSNLVPDQVQHQLTQVYADILIQTKDFLKHDDLRCSALLTIKNLLAAAGNIPLMQQSNDGNDCQFSELDEMKIFWNEISKLDFEGFSSSNDSRMKELEEMLNDGLRKIHFEDASILPDEIKDTQERIRKFRQQRRMHSVEDEMKFLNKLKELNELVELIAALRSAPTSLAIHPFEENKKQEYLKNLREDLAAMPMCAERTLVELRLQLESGTTSSYDNSVRTVIDTLKNQLTREELLSETNQGIVQNLDLAISSNDRPSTIRHLEELRKQIRVLNIPEICRLVAKSHEAAQLIRGKDIVLLLGETGSGKSTTIQFLAGLSMKVVQVPVATGKFLEHITAVGPIKNPQLNEVISSPLSQSETRYIIPVTIPLNDVFGSHETGGMILCDAPGFNDTAGAEVDIANSIGMIEALRGTNSVKILTLSCFKDLGSRGQGIERLAKLLIRMIDDIEDRLSSIVYAFTQYPEETNVNVLIESIKISRLELDSSSRSTVLLTTVLNDMSKKTQETIYKINPIHDDRKILLRKLRGTRGISYPREVFRLAMSESTRTCIINQVQKNKFGIIRAITQQNIDLVHYYLNELKILNDWVTDDSIRSLYEDSIRFVNETIDEYCRKMMTQFNSILRSQQGLSEKDVLDYKSIIDYLIRVEILKEHRNSSAFTSKILIDNIISQLQERYDSVRNEELYCVLVKVYLDNLCMLNNSFEELHSYHENVCKEYEKRFEELAQSAREPIQVDDFACVAGILLKLNRSLYNLKSYLGERIESKYHQLVQSLLRHLENLSKDAEFYLAKIRLNDNDLEKLKQYMEKLQSAKDNSLLQQCLGIDISRDSIRIYNEFLEKIVTYFQQLAVKISEILSTNNTDVLDDVGKWIHIMRTLHEMPQLKAKTAEKYAQTAETLRGYLHSTQNNIEQSIVSLQQQSQTVNIKLLARCINRLKKAKWIDSILPGVHDALMHRLTDEFIEYFQQFDTILKRLDFSYKCSDNIPIAVDIIRRMESVSILEQSIPELEKYHREISEYFQQRVKKVFEWISTSFCNEKMIELDASAANYALIYLKECEDINYHHIRETALQTHEDLQQYLSQYGQVLNTEIRKSFEQTCRLGEDLAQCSQELGTNLNQLSSLSKFPHVFQCLEGTEKVDYWLREFLDTFRTISAKLEDCKSLHHTKELRVQLVVVQALSVVDRFCATQFHDQGFAHLYRQYQLEMTRAIKVACEKIRESVSRGDYAEADLVLQDIDQDLLNEKDRIQIKHDLENSIEQLMQTTKSFIIWLNNKPNEEKDQIKLIKENVDKIRIALKKFNILHLLAEKIQINLRNFDHEINEMLCEILLKRLDAIEVYIQTDHFLEADQSLENLNRIQRDLVGYCTSPDVIGKSEELRERLDKTLNDALQREQFLDIDKYPIHPPKEFLEKLDKLIQHGQVRYKQVYTSLLAVIKEQFSQRIEKARVALPEERQIKIESLNRALYSLPEVLQTYFKLPMEELNKLMNQEDLRITTTEVLAQRYTVEKQSERLKELREKTMSQLHEYQMSMQNCLDKQQTHDAIDILRKIVKYKEVLGKYFPEIEQVYHRIHLRIMNDISSCYTTLSDLSSIELTQTVENAVNRLIIYWTCPDLIEEKTREDMRVKLQTYLAYLVANSNQFQTVVDQMNMTDIHRCMMIAKKWNDLILKIRQVFPQEMIGILSYTEMISQLRKSVEEFANECFADDQLLSEKNITKIISIIKGLSSEYKDILLSIFDMKKFEQKLEDFANQFVNSALMTDLSPQATDSFRLSYRYLSRFDGIISLSGRSIRDFLNAFKEKIFERIARLCEQVIDENELSEKLKYFGEKLLILNISTDFRMDRILQIYKEQQDRSRIKRLIMSLSRLEIGRNLVHCLNVDDWRNRWQQMEHQHNLEYILENLTGDQLDKSTLARYYQTFQQIYNLIIYQFSTALNAMKSIDRNLSALGKHIHNMANMLVQTFSTNAWGSRLIDGLIHLIAHVFALWTLINTDCYSATDSYLLTPHVGQVIAVFRLLGLDSPIDMPMTSSNLLINHSMEIGTGEGKSVVLAMTACVFALLGFDVNCACYSQELCTRDWNMFNSIFRALDLAERVTYVSFYQMCERLVSEQCDAREKIRDMILNNRTAIAVDQVKINTCRKVLLIDEMDMLLSDRFYAELHRSSVIVKSKLIKLLFDDLWQNKTLRSLESIKALPRYKNCVKIYSNWTSLLDDAIEEMLVALESFSSSPYLVQNDKIVYILDESIVDNLIHGYHTMWAYYHENEKGKISQSSLENNIGLLVNCGIFSYAELLHDYFYIGGVTGTLRILIQSEKDILRKVYGIRKNTYIPSIFGKSNRSFNPVQDVHLVEESEYFKRIRAEIDFIRQVNRAILIFFESKDKLMKFYRSSALSSIKQEVQILTEKLSQDERDLLIDRAMNIGRVTLLTRTFNRGVDFICRNSQVLINGGVHVLQTFFSKDLSKEQQIMARGARQGKPGSYRIVLLDKDLEWLFGSTWKKELSQIPDKDLYETLNKARQRSCEIRCAIQHRNIGKCAVKHRNSLDFLFALCTGEIDTVKRFLNKQTSKPSHFQFSS